MLVNEIKGKAESIASTVASVVDGDIISKVQPGDEESDEYLTVSKMLTPH